MSTGGAEPTADITWARTVNRRWIVHHGLKECTEAFLSRLEETDPVRLSHACRRARQLVASAGPDEDPKPWFYAGVFSVATVEEAGRYLRAHWFTAACLPGLAASPDVGQPPADLAPETRAKLDRIQHALRRLDAGA